MTSRHLSIRSRLLASVVAISFAPGMALAADVTVSSGQTRTTPVLASGPDVVTVETGGAITPPTQLGVVWNADTPGTAPLTINNAGTISSGSAPAIGSSAARSGALIITNTGTISSPSQVAIALGNSTGAITLNNYGSISATTAAAVFGSGNDTLNLFTGSSLSGPVLLGTGTNTVNLSGSTATKTAAQAFGKVFGAETVNINTGYWTLKNEIGANNVNIASGATLDIDDVNAGADGAFISSFAADDSLHVNNGGKLLINTADTRLDVDADDLYLAGAGSVELTGGGSIQYGAHVTATGTTTITNGMIVVHGDATPGGFVVGQQGVLRLGAALSAPDADGFATIVSGGGATGMVSGDVVNNGQVIVDRSNAATYAGVMSGSGSLTKMGTGVLTLSGQNTYTGATTLQQGGLIVTGALASSGVTTASGTTLTFNTPNNSTYAGVISGQGTLVKGGSSALTLSGANTFTGPTLVTGGGLVVSGSTISGINMTAPGTTLTVAQGGSTRSINGTNVTVTNAGTIATPLITGGATASVTLLGTTGNVLNNSGVIRSYNDHAVTFGAGADTLNLSTGSSIIGQVQMGDGNDTVNLSGSLAAKSASQSFGRIYGVNLVNVNSGYWTLINEIGAEAVSVASGATLEIDDVNAGPDGAYISATDALTITNNGKLIVNTADNRVDVFADDLRLGGSGNLELIGGGVIQYGANMTMTGVTSVANGTIIVQADNTPGSYVVGQQGTLRLGAAFSAPDADGYVTLTTGGGASGMVSGTITNNGNVIVDRSNAATYAGVMTGTGSLTKTGLGALTLSGQNTYTGATTLSGGSLVVSGSLASSGIATSLGTQIVFNAPNSSTYAGAITGAGTVQKNGAATLTLSGANTYTGGTSITGGALNLTGSVVGVVNMASGTTLNIASTGAARFINGQGVSVTNAGVIETPLVTTGAAFSVALGGATGNTLTNSGTIRSYNGHAISFGAGADTLNLATGSVIVGDVVTGSGADTVNLAGTVNTKTNSQVFGDIYGSEVLNVNSGYWTLRGEVGADTATIAAGATLEVEDTQTKNSIISHDGVLNVTVNGKLLYNSFDAGLYDDFEDNHFAGSGQIEITGGASAIFGSATNFTGLTTVTNGQLIVTGNLAGGASVGANGVLRVGAAFSAPDANGMLTIVAGGGATGSVGGNIANAGVVTFDRSNAHTYGGSISGSGVVNKMGTGNLTLAGANTYTGVTNVSAGGLTITGSSFTSSNVALSAGTSLTYGSANPQTYGGVISGAGTLTKVGAGALTLSGANTYTGATTVIAGVLNVTGSIASTNVAVTSGANLTFGSASNLTYSGVVSGAGSLTKTGAGALTLTGANTYTGGTNVSGGSLILTTTLNSNTTVNAGGTLQIGTGGTTGSLVGSLVDNGTVIFNRSDDYVLTGSFSGNGSLIKRGAGKLTLDGVYTFSGTTTIESGSVKITQLDSSGNLVIGSGSNVDLSGSTQTVGGLAGGTGSTVNIDGGSLTINAPASNTTTVYSGSLTGNGSLTVTGSGTTDLAGTNTYTGPTQVNGGTLKVNGSISSPTTVNTGGTLGGSGQINAPVNVASGGTLSPGNSPGTLTVAGNLTLAAGSTTIIEVDPTLTPNHDQINVTGGSATIATGAKLSVRPLGAISNYARTQTYTILTATGGVNGTFAAGDVSSTMALLTPRLSYAANQVNLQLIRNDISFASLAGTANQAAVGAAAEASGPASAAYNSLIAQDQAGARTGYDALSGEAYGAVGSLLLNESRSARDTLLARAGDAKGRGAWLQVVDNTTTLDASANAAGAKDQDFGLIGGGEAGTEALKFGFALGYGKSDISVGARASSADVETFHGGVYGGGNAGGFRYAVGLDYGQSSVDSARAIVFPTVSQSVKGSYDITTTNVFGEVSYPAKLAGVALEPFAGLGHVQVKSDGFAETGGTLALNVAAQTRSVTTTVLGARLNGVWGASDATTTYPRLSVAWQRASGDVEGTSTAAFGASAFTVTGASLPKNAALIDAGVGLNIWGSGKAWLSYSGLLSSEGNSNGVKAGFAFNF